MNQKSDDVVDAWWKSRCIRITKRKKRESIPSTSVNSINCEVESTFVMSK
jgi:hypothetical protein